MATLTSALQPGTSNTYADSIHDGRWEFISPPVSNSSRRQVDLAADNTM